eukprot:gb/GECH01009762.1/.p1 GENE.gb/GECH01009762.1/~~gb/GECH01009762.1/.p1  ORF type:complete len:757 (+),score=124.82 gb/GECH01009762.1/:1-2271(+)
MFGRRSSKRTTDRNASKRPALVFEDKWADLKGGIQKLLDFINSDMKRPFDVKEHARLYTIVYDLCTQRVDISRNGPATDVLYERYKSTFHDYLAAHVVLSLKEKQGETLLMEAVKRWREHQVIVKWMMKVFRYLDLYYTKHSNKDSLRDVGLKSFQEHVYGSIKQDMARALLDKIHQEREGDLIDRSVMKDGVQLFIEMGLNTLKAYENDLESLLIAETSEFYKRESSRWISEDSCPTYMLKVEERLQQELNRARSYLHESSENNLIKVAENELIKNHQTTLLEMQNSGFIPLLRDYKLEDLSRMYRLFKRVSGLMPMSEKFRDYVTQEGLQLLKKHEQTEKLDVNAFIDELILLHDKYEKLATEEFQKDTLFLQAMKDAFTTIVNKEVNNVNASGAQHMTELLSTYCDNLMRNTHIEEDELDQKLESIVKLFNYVGEKDMFQEFYRRQLSRRLLVFSKLNVDAERSFITKLKMRQGASFTSKLEGMINDKKLSEDLQRQFKDYLSQKGNPLSIDFSPQVLTTGFWPSGFQVDQINVPVEMQRCMEVFKEFYDSRTQSRILKWVHSLGTTTVMGRFASNTYDIQCSTYQACVLLSFNQTAQLSVSDLQRSLNLPLEEVQRAVISLSFGKHPVLSKTNNKEKRAQPGDEFQVNAAFKSKSLRVKIKNVLFQISQEERTRVEHTTQEDRKHTIDAAIVRIMKARKVLDHQKLILEVSQQLMSHFTPDPKLIKYRIGDLISREYLERDSDKKSVYRYLA